MNTVTLSPVFLITSIALVCFAIGIPLILYLKEKKHATGALVVSGRLASQIEKLFDRYESKDIAQAEDIDSFLEACVETAVTSAEADAGAVFMADRESTDELAVSAGRNLSLLLPLPEKDSPDALTVSLQEPLIRRVIGVGRAEIFHHGAFCTLPDSAFQLNRLQSVICYPLRHKEEILGVLFLAREKGRRNFSTSNVDALSLLLSVQSKLISTSIDFIRILQKRSIETETRIARHIQKLVNPEKLSGRDDLSFAVYSASAPGIHTDYYDVFRIKADRYVLLVCEVAGKSVPAGLVMLMIRTLVRLVSRTSHDPAKIVEIVNNGIAQKIDMDHFAACNYILYDPSTLTLSIVCAGYMPILFFHHDTQEVEKITGSDPPLGIDRKSSYKRTTVNVSSGDVLLLFSDGIPDALSPEGSQYGIENLTAVLTDNYYLSAEDLKNTLRDHISRFTQSEEPHDDQTLLIMKIT